MGRYIKRRSLGTTALAGLGATGAAVAVLGVVLWTGAGRNTVQEPAQVSARIPLPKADTVLVPAEHWAPATPYPAPQYAPDPIPEAMPPHGPGRTVVTTVQDDTMTLTPVPASNSIAAPIATTQGSGASGGRGEGAASVLPVAPQPVPANDAAAEPASETEVIPAPTTTVTLAPNRSLWALLDDQGLAAPEIAALINSLRPVRNPDRLAAGQPVTLRIVETSEGRRLDRLVLEPFGTPRAVLAGRSAKGGFDVVVEEVPLQRTPVAARVILDQNLYDDARAVGVPASVLTDTLRRYAFSVDFQRDLRKGDVLEILYVREASADGQLERFGPVRYTNLVLGGTDHRMYRHAVTDGEPRYFTATGRSIRSRLLRTPVDAARMSSGFGMRMHPILGYRRMHKGVDFAAPTGTAVYAAGAGTVMSAGWRGSYGKTVEIRHDSRTTTLYAHLNQIPAGIRRGARVRQLDIIGRVGSTGRSTGPHLHFEVRHDGRAVDPAKHTGTGGTRLAGAALERFEQSVADLDAAFVHALLGGNTQVAMLEAE